MNVTRYQHLQKDPHLKYIHVPTPPPAADLTSWKKSKKKTTAKTVQQFDATGWLQVTLTKSLSEL